MAKEKHVELLQQGSLVWGMTREQRPDVIPDLSGADLQNVYLMEFDLHSANFERANLSGADLKCTNLRAANFTGANLTGANLSCADCRGAILTNAILIRANLCLAEGLTQEQIAGARVDVTTSLPDYLDF